MSAPGEWTLKCGGCDLTIDGIAPTPKGDPDYTKLPEPWRNFQYESKNMKRTCIANACSDVCERRFRGRYEKP